MFVQTTFSKPPDILLPNLVGGCIIMSQGVMLKDWFAIFKVKVTARAHMIEIWQFLLYFLNCWPFCCQTWFHDTLSWARVCYEETGLLWSRSRSQQNFERQWMSVQMMSSEPLNLLPPNVEWWCIIMSQGVFQNDWFAVFKVMVTVTGHNYDQNITLIYLLNYWSFCSSVRFNGTPS